MDGFLGKMSTDASATIARLPFMALEASLVLMNLALSLPLPRAELPRALRHQPAQLA